MTAEKVRLKLSSKATGSMSSSTTEVFASTAQEDKEKKDFRFTDELDLKLLRFVNTIKPHLATHGLGKAKWTDIAQKFSPSMQWYVPYQRTLKLSGEYREKCKASELKSGVTETFSPLEQEISLFNQDQDMKQEEKSRKRATKENETLKNDELAENVRDSALKVLGDKPKKERKVERESKIGLQEAMALFLKAKSDQIVKNPAEYEIRKLELENEARAQILKLKELEIEEMKLKNETSKPISN